MGQKNLRTSADKYHIVVFVKKLWIINIEKSKTTFLPQLIILELFRFLGICRLNEVVVVKNFK